MRKGYVRNDLNSVKTCSTVELIIMKLSVAYDFLPKQPSSHASIVMDHFGIGFETGRNVIAENLELPIEAGDVVCFTGA